MRFFLTLVFSFLLCFSSGIAVAENSELTGAPAVLPSGLLMIGGHDITLWGIDPLANDQECWHDDRAWDCGEEALTVLRHYLTGTQARCVVKTDAGGMVSAQCFRTSNGKEEDIARHLVSEGWARDRRTDSGGLYAPDQDEARRNHRGIWTSRFQSAEDWKNGVPHYIVYETASPKEPAADEVPDNTQ